MNTHLSDDHAGLFHFIMTGGNDAVAYAGGGDSTAARGAGSRGRIPTPPSPLSFQFPLELRMHDSRQQHQYET